MDNDRTIGRANARQGASASSSGVAASASAASSAAAASASGGQQPPASPAGKSSRPSHADHAGAPKTTAKASAAPLEWPTSSDHYQLMNRVGQGAFASVWRARIVTVSNDDDAVEREEEVQECAIKIMDLEHVNINISGRNCLNLESAELMKSFFPRLIDRCRHQRKALSLKPVDNLG
ncbi:hypothetical protein THAOC_37798 [Thalassiosira oceanica]|uniref:Protein kinase domain-containing protein n=1 Tax=Thalassiosira oceanica TaxID=159749 RepID=K0R5E8_THAOC|nr:hypothetical protein THAOC_37798 [Thalassiosira oceanica]|eukprot:EJK43731.1 hypothetical protein THAOC_37798 [Thalassiosira oceanica]